MTLPLDSLPALLRERARVNGSRAALSFKVRGAWRTFTWQALSSEVQRVAAGLGSAGLDAGQTFLVSGLARVKQLVSALAAASVGACLVIRPGLARAGSARFAFAADSSELYELFEQLTGTPSKIVFDGAGRAPSGLTPEVLAYVALRACESERTAELGRTGELVVESEGAFARHSWSQWFAAAEPASRALSATDQVCMLEPDLAVENAALLVTSWLRSGFELGLVESPASAAGDARELGATARFTSARRLEQWANDIEQRLSSGPRSKNALAHWALSVVARERPLLIARLVASLIVIRPLRRALGLDRLRLALSADGLPGEHALRLASSLGLRLAAPDAAPTNRTNLREALESVPDTARSAAEHPVCQSA